MVVALDHIWELRNDNKKKMMILDPSKVATKITRRHCNYEEAWAVKRIKMTHHKKKVERRAEHVILSSDDAIKGEEACLAVACSDLFGSIVAAYSFLFRAYTTILPKQEELEWLIKASKIAISLDSHVFKSTMMPRV